MKLIFTLVSILSVLLIGCSVPLLSDSAPPQLGESIAEISQWIDDNIHPEEDIENYGMSEYWAYPNECYNNLAGDCEDVALLTLWEASTFLGIPEYELRFVGTPGHALIKVRNEYWDIMNNRRVDISSYKGYEEMPYSKAFWLIPYKRY